MFAIEAIQRKWEPSIGLICIFRVHVFFSFIRIHTELGARAELPAGTHPNLFIFVYCVTTKKKQKGFA